MSDTISFHGDLIRSLGGKAVVARALGEQPALACKWHVRGIPSKFWGEVVALAAKAGISVTLADLKRTKPATGGAAACASS